MKQPLKETRRYLEEDPRARERSNRYKAIRNMILAELPSIAGNITKDQLEEVVFNAIQLNRCIQRNQQLFENLRGSDYDEKKVELEQQAQIDLEYLPGEDQDNRKLKTLL